MAFRYSPKIINDGLVFLMDGFNTKSYSTGLTASDIANSAKGTLTNGVLHDGSSFDFDGIDDYITFGNIPSINNIGTGDFTMEMWIKPDALSPQNYEFPIFKNTDAYQTEKGFIFEATTYTSGDTSRFRVSFYITNAGGSPSYTSIGQQNIAGESTYGSWYHYVITRETSSTTLKLYLDGELNNSNTDAKMGESITSPSPDFTIGERISAGGNDEYKGLVSNIKVYNRVLTDSEILQNYNTLKGRFDS